MNNDIVTRLEQEIDFVEYLRLWASPDGNDQAVKDLHKAADEIECLRAELDHWQHVAKTLGDGYSLTVEQRPALQAVYERFYADCPAVKEAI